MTAAALRAKPAAGQAPGGDALAAWAEHTGRRQAAEHGRGEMRFVFYGRLSTEDLPGSGDVAGRGSETRLGRWWPGTATSWPSSSTSGRTGRWRGRDVHRPPPWSPHWLTRTAAGPQALDSLRDGGDHGDARRRNSS